MARTKEHTSKNILVPGYTSIIYDVDSSERLGTGIGSNRSEARHDAIRDMCSPKKK